MGSEVDREVGVVASASWIKFRMMTFSFRIIFLALPDRPEALDRKFFIRRS